MPKKKLCVTLETLYKLQEAFKDDKEVLEELELLKTCKKRKPSAYQEFVGQCLKKGGSIKSCAGDWRKKKG